jgi:type VI secretion system secreted protein VgrG
MDDKIDSPKIQLHTKDQHNRLHLDATEQAHQINLVSEQGEVRLISGSHMILQSGGDQHVEVENDHNVVVGGEHKLLTEQGRIEYQSAEKISFRAESDIEWQSINGGIEIHSKEDLLLEAEESVRFHSVKGNLEWIADDGDISLSANANITLKSAQKGVIQISQGKGSLEIDGSGNFIIDAPKVEINAQNIAIKASSITSN